MTQFEFVVSPAEIASMAEKRKTHRLSLAKANRARKKLGLLPLGILAASGKTVIRVPRKW